jgi:hypothetical protein
LSLVECSIISDLLVLCLYLSWLRVTDSYVTNILSLSFVTFTVSTYHTNNRYLAILHPLESRRRQSKKRTLKILILVWILPCLFSTPFLYPSEAVSNVLSSDYGTISRLTCFTNFSPEFRKYYFTFLFIFFYFLPLLFISWTCTQIMLCLLKTNVSYREGSLRRQDANRRKVSDFYLLSIDLICMMWS